MSFSYNIIIVVIYLILLLSTFTTSISIELTPELVPNPIKSPKLCGREKVKSSAICDIDHLLVEESKNVIEGYINAITTAEIGVLIINRISQQYIKDSSSTDYATEKFAVKIHNEWGVGDRVKQNGVLIFLSIYDRQMYISRGSGVDTILTDTLLDSIIKKMRSHLRNADYGRAIEECIIHLDILLKGDKGEIESMFTKDEINEKSNDWDDYNNFICVGLICFLAFGCLINGKKINDDMKKMEKGKEALNKLMREVKEDDDEEELRNNKIVQNEDNDAIDNDANESVSNKYHVKSCPICLEDFPNKTSKALNKEATKENETNNVANDIDIEDQKLSSSNTDINRPMALPCNHVFCFECLDAFLNSKDGNKCPICRTPVDNSKPPIDDINQGRRGCYTNFRNDSFTSNRSWSRRSLEYRFRMHRLNHYYPNVVTSEVLRSTDSSLNNVSSHNFLQNLQVRSKACTKIITDYNIRQKASESGSKGSSRSSFGGGRSRGGRSGKW